MVQFFCTVSMRAERFSTMVTPESGFAPSVQIKTARSTGLFQGALPRAELHGQSAKPLVNDAGWHHKNSGRRASGG
jgi:hypothetical protein